MLRYIFLFLLTLLINSQQPSQRLRSRVDYMKVFSDKSDVSAVITSCSMPETFKKSIESFLFFNTKPLKKLFIVHCSSKKTELMNALPFAIERYTNYVQIMFSEEGKHMVEVLDQVLQHIDTKYVYQSDGIWQMVRGFGFLEQAKIILEEREKEGLNVSQVISFFPLLREIAYLSPLQWTSSGLTYHSINPFTPERYEYFTFGPSLYNFQEVYQKALRGSFASFGKDCPKTQISQFDKCTIWNIGQYLHSLGFEQLYLNDGSDESYYKVLQ